MMSPELKSVDNNKFKLKKRKKTREMTTINLN